MSSRRIKIGLLLDPGTPPEEIPKYARFAENAGFYGIWGGDTPTTPHAPVVLTLMAQYTSTIPIGYSLTNPYVRHVVKTAVSAATLDDASNQRLIFTFGAGTLEGLQAIGMDWIRPVLHIREAITVCRRLWAGETVTFEGETTQVKNTRLYRPPKREDIPVYIGCRRPYMARLAGEIAEGIILDNIPLGYSDYIQKQLQKGADKAGRKLTKNNFCVANMSTWSVSHNRQEAMDSARFLVPIDFITISDREIKAAGLTHDDVAPIQKALQQQTLDSLKEAANHVTDHMINEFSVAGTPEDCIERISQFEKKGFDLIILALPTEHKFKPWQSLRLAKEEILPYFAENDFSL
ncbi:MAG: LLM class flavin-dependent oxidoreductase [Candidatus Ranarchaeia archaeon]